MYFPDWTVLTSMLDARIGPVPAKPKIAGLSTEGSDPAALVLSGGYPEPLARSAEQRRRSWSAISHGAPDKHQARVEAYTFPSIIRLTSNLHPLSLAFVRLPSGSFLLPDDLERYMRIAQRLPPLLREAAGHEHHVKLAQLAERMQRHAVELVMVDQ
jgi:hypothetical protein